LASFSSSSPPPHSRPALLLRAIQQTSQCRCLLCWIARRDFASRGRAFVTKIWRGNLDVQPKRRRALCPFHM
jgi:hypothetical protein